ncbi:MAG: hypothetical protein KC910_09720 [Candidatus Eremiobacteraeota bacterium]|nr:hypothetical protein [Candidatus Eremiobacteraeota bacterium]
MSTLNAAGNQGQTQVRRARGATTSAPPRQAEGPRPSRNEMRAQALANLRQREAAAPQGTAGKKTLAAQADRASQARGTTLTDPGAIINHELKSAGLDDDFNKLSPRGQQQYLALARELVADGTSVNTGGGKAEMPNFAEMTPEQRTQHQAEMGGTLARRNLMNLLEDGKLNDTDSQGRTLLSNLDHMRTDKYAKLDNKAALQATLSQVGMRAGPYGGQGSYASQNASEYTRISHELWSNGQTKLPNGDTIKTPTGPPEMPKGFGGIGMGMPGNPELMAVPRALSEYAKAQADKPENRAEFRERAAGLLQGDQRAAYDRLNPAQRNQVIDLATRPGERENAVLAKAFQSAPSTPNLNGSVTSLLGDGKLTQKDSQGRTLMDNLSAIRGDNEFLFDQTTNLLAGRPDHFAQASRSWTLPAEQKLRTDQPAEYARLIHGLTSGDHSVKMADGQVLKGAPAATGPFGGGLINPATLIPNAMAEGAMSSGKPLTMVNSNGETFEAQIQHVTTGKSGNEIYKVGVGDHQFWVNSEVGSDVRGSLLDLANFDSMTPDHLKGELRQVNLKKGSNPSDPQWAVKYGMPDFHSAATAGGHVINFWDGTSNVNETTFNHEMGHLIGARRGFTDSVYDKWNFTEDAGNVPIGWDDRIKKDGQSVSDYGDKAIGEDFAESWAHYMEARIQGTPAMTKFRTEHPNRFELVDRVYNDGDTW